MSIPVVRLGVPDNGTEYPSSPLVIMAGSLDYSGYEPPVGIGEPSLNQAAPFEAAPFYTGVRVRRKASGQRQRTVIYNEGQPDEYTMNETVSVNYDVESTFERVSAMPDTSGGFMLVQGDEALVRPFGQNGAVKYVGGAGAMFGENECVIESGGNRAVSPYASKTITASERTVRTYVGDSAPDDEDFTSNVSVELRPPVFTSTYATTFTPPYDRWGPDEIWSGEPWPSDTLDISGWNLAQWWDLRGKHALSVSEELVESIAGSYDTNTVVHKYEWELTGAPDLNFSSAPQSQYAPLL